MNPPFPNHVLNYAGHKSAGRGLRLAALLRSNRFTLGGAILIALVLPELLHPVFNHSYPWARVFHPSEPELSASAIALIIAHIGLRNIGDLPLVDDKVFMLPIFLATYTAVAVLGSYIFGLTGRYHLVSSFSLGLAWYYAMALLRARHHQPRLAFVGAMAVDEELLGTRIEWVALPRPQLPRQVFGIVFDADQPLSPDWERFFARAVLRNIPVYELNALREMATGRVRLRERPELVFGQLLPSQPYLRIKRVIDTIFAVPALVLAAPIIGLAALLIRLDSPGPAMFTQRRVGYQGRTFSCYKLRTMHRDCGGTAWTEQDDARITRLGHFLRKWRIDELPQIVNVLKGEMSWIGPRPEAVPLSRLYQSEIAFYPYRHTVRPGISGWAAVHQGNVALTDAVTRKLEYDFYYIKYFSIWLDFLIGLMTVRTVLTGFGSR